MSGAIALGSTTPESWAVRSAARLPELLADHAVCELQASVYALSLVGAYPEDAELVDRLSASDWREHRCCHCRSSDRKNCPRAC